MSLFPTAYDNPTDPTPTSDTATLSHADQHADLHSIVRALEAVVGKTGETNQASIAYKLATLTGAEQAASVTDLASQIAAAQTTLNASITTLNNQMTSLLANLNTNGTPKSNVITSAMIAAGAVGTSDITPNAVTKVLLEDYWWDISGTPRTIAAGLSGQWGGTEDKDFTTTGGLLEVAMRFDGLSLDDNGIGYVGFVIDGATTYELFARTNTSVALTDVPRFTLSGSRFVTLPAGPHVITPFGRNDSLDATFTWENYNSITVNILEHKR